MVKAVDTSCIVRLDRKFLSADLRIRQTMHTELAFDE